MIGTLVALCWVPTLAWAQAGFQIANDPDLFSARFRVEFRDMNETFAEFGFEVEVIDGERPPLAAIREKYGEPERSEEVDVVLGFGSNERPVTLTFYYYGDIGFGVLPQDAEQSVMRVKRREG